MSYIKINIYYKDAITDSFTVKIGEKIRTLDDARYLVISHLDSFYSDIKYKIKLFRTFDGESEIKIFFEESLNLSRDIKLRQLLQ